MRMLLAFKNHSSHETHIAEDIHRIERFVGKSEAINVCLVLNASQGIPYSPSGCVNEQAGSRF